MGLVNGDETQDPSEQAQEKMWVMKLQGLALNTADN